MLWEQRNLGICGLEDLGTDRRKENYQILYYLMSSRCFRRFFSSTGKEGSRKSLSEHRKSSLLYLKTSSGMTFEAFFYILFSLRPNFSLFLTIYCDIKFRRTFS